MAKKKLYSIQLKNKRTDPERKLPWYCPIEAQFVSREFTKGYIACSQGYNPSFDIRVVDAHTKEIIEEIEGNEEMRIRI